MPADDSGAGAVAIILSYLRPQNIPRIVRELALASQVARIVVSNNNPDVDLSLQLPGSPKLTLVQQPRRFRPWKRFDIAVHDAAEHFICIDDDLFPSHAQIDALLRALDREPQVPHGVWGERLVVLPREIQFQSGLRGVDVPVDVINRCYTFTREHALRLFRLAALVGRTTGEQIGPGDDILLSFSGSSSPRCHALGPFEECPTGNDPAIAVWKQAEFYQRRGKLLLQLLGLPRDCTEWWPQRMAGLRQSS